VVLAYQLAAAHEWFQYAEGSLEHGSSPREGPRTGNNEALVGGDILTSRIVPGRLAMALWFTVSATGPRVTPWARCHDLRVVDLQSSGAPDDCHC